MEVRGIASMAVSAVEEQRVAQGQGGHVWSMINLCSRLRTRRLAASSTRLPGGRTSESIPVFRARINRGLFSSCTVGA